MTGKLKGLYKRFAIAQKRQFGSDKAVELAIEITIEQHREAFIELEKT